MPPRTNSTGSGASLATTLDFLWGEKAKNKRQSASFEEDDGFVFKRLPFQSSVGHSSNGKSSTTGNSKVPIPVSSSRTHDLTRGTQSRNGNTTTGHIRSRVHDKSTRDKDIIPKTRREEVALPSKKRAKSPPALFVEDSDEAESRTAKRSEAPPLKKKRQVFSFDDFSEESVRRKAPKRKTTKTKKPIKKKVATPEKPKPKPKPRPRANRTSPLKRFVESEPEIEPELEPEVEVPSALEQPEYDQDMYDFGSGGDHYEHADTSFVPLNGSPKQSVDESYDLSDSRRASFYRRASLGNRGKRLSSIGNGYRAEPHSDIPPQEFFKHLDASVPDVQRMRQLIVWATKRAISTAESQGRYNLSSRKEDIANVIQSSFLRDLMDGTIEPDWARESSRKDASANSSLNEPIYIAPHPENQMNLKIKSELEERLRNLKNEERIWKSIKEESNQISHIDIGSIDVPETEAYQKVKQFQDGIESKNTVLGIVKQINRSVEFLKSAVHKARSTIEAVKLLTEDASHEAFTQIQQSIEVDEEGDKVEPEDLLKGLSKLAYLEYEQDNADDDKEDEITDLDNDEDEEEEEVDEN